MDVRYSPGATDDGLLSNQFSILIVGERRRLGLYYLAAVRNHRTQPAGDVCGLYTRE